MTIVEIIAINPLATAKMSSNVFTQSPCVLCSQSHWDAHMTERSDGLYCEPCASLPPYSDGLFSAIVSFQELFRTYFKARAKQCFNCEKFTLTLHEFEGGLVCEHCEEELTPPSDEEEEEEEGCDHCGHALCHCDDGGGSCEECGNPYECVCAELKEDAYLARHRRICGLPDCDGTCGTMDCGCVDKCKCDY